MHDVNTKDVYVRVWSAFSDVNGKLIKLGENVLDAQKFISEYPVNELNKQINEIYLRDNISHEKSEFYFFKDKEVDDSYIFSKKELEVIYKGFELDPDELSAKYRTMYSAKEHPNWGYSYDVAFAELNAFVEGRELYKVSFLVPCDFHDEMTQEILGHIDGSLKVVDESNNGYVIVECLYNSLSDVAYADLSEHKTYYLDSYFTAKNNEGEMVYCGHTFGPIKEECRITDVTKEMSSKVM